MGQLAQKFSSLNRAEKAVVSGFPDGGTSEWHVQTTVRIGHRDSRRVTVLQRTARPDQWMTVVMTQTESALAVESIAVDEGEPPTHGTDETAVAIDPGGLEIVETGPALYSDRE